jgi:hypothetical protein
MNWQFIFLNVPLPGSTCTFAHPVAASPGDVWSGMVVSPMDGTQEPREGGIVLQVPPSLTGVAGDFPLVSQS